MPKILSCIHNRGSAKVGIGHEKRFYQPGYTTPKHTGQIDFVVGGIKDAADRSTQKVSSNPGVDESDTSLLSPELKAEYELGGYMALRIPEEDFGKHTDRARDFMKTRAYDFLDWKKFKKTPISANKYIDYCKQIDGAEILRFNDWVQQDNERQALYLQEFAESRGLEIEVTYTNSQ